MPTRLRWTFTTMREGMRNGSMAAADDWSFAKHIRSRGEAIRQLVALGA